MAPFFVRYLVCAGQARHKSRIYIQTLSGECTRLIQAFDSYSIYKLLWLDFNLMSVEAQHGCTLSSAWLNDARTGCPTTAKYQRHLPVMSSWVWGLRINLASFSHAEDNMQPCCASTDIKLKSNHNNLYYMSQMPELVSCTRQKESGYIWQESGYICETYAWLAQHTPCRYCTKNGAMWIYAL